MKIAHAKKDHAGKWCEHELSQHLQKVGILSSTFSSHFDSGDWAKAAGDWHDLGKYRPRFQNYIRDKSGYERENAHVETTDRPRHSTAGAIHAVDQWGDFYGHIIAYLIAGHHAGLPDWAGGRGGLSHRLEDTESQDEYEESLEAADDFPLLHANKPALPDFIDSPYKFALWMRMMFSSLVDADFLDTEQFMDPSRTLQRGGRASFNELQQRFDVKMAELKTGAASSPMAIIRNEIQQQCLKAADWRPGLFSLTVPTGGGKTLSSLAFALKHARIFNKQRIIYAIPFTSIIEQNADVFRDFLGGDDAVLEHHSNLDVSEQKENSRSRLASENWDAPVVVTTNVQLFESLHATRTSRCRKLHNLANSIIILDEAQQLPRDFHAPITKVMQQLADHYGVTWVLCTATQPVLTEQRSAFNQLLMQGLNHVREIIQQPERLAKKLNARVHVQLPDLGEPPLSWTDLAEKLSDEEAVLCIVNTRPQARELYGLLQDKENSVHLSAQMCAEHRSTLIEQMKQRLQARVAGDKRPIRVISTQLIEAGVDVDFPLVYRATAGLDSIAQSAGRCNRESNLDEPGKVIVFKPEKSSFGFLRQAEDATLELLACGQLDEPLSPTSFTRFFRLLNSKGKPDKHGILELLRAKCSRDAPLEIYFREAAAKFRLIDDNGVSIIVPYVPFEKKASPIHAWLALLEEDASRKWVYRKLQRYTVTLPEWQANQLAESGCIDTVAGLRVLQDGFYHPDLGIYTPDLQLSGQESVL